jgi:hypothetical protein
VLLTPAGPIVFNLKYQSGNIVAQGDKWKQSGIGLRRFFGQEGLGNPNRETESMWKALANFIRKNAPEVEEQIGELPIAAMIVFTTKGIKNVQDSSIPAMHVSKVRGFLKQRGRGEPLPEETYRVLRAAFDREADGLVDDNLES